MNILIAGASGLVGRNLIPYLSSNGHEITVLGRNIEKIKKLFPKNEALIWHDLPQTSAKKYDIIINLCGENIGAKAWNAKVKEEIISSRVRTNQTLIDWVIKSEAAPRFISASAIGYYGLQKLEDASTFTEKSLTETAPINDFMREICVAWENSLIPAIEAGLSVTICRFGVILDKKDGMLKKLLLPFSFGLGSIIGSGQQVISWVHIKDVVAAISFLIDHASKAGGVFNICSPEPITQELFAKTLAHLLKKPIFIKLPTFLVKVIFGEMGECLLLSGQRVFPKRLLESGFNFSYKNLTEALNNLLSN